MLSMRFLQRKKYVSEQAVQQKKQDRKYTMTEKSINQLAETSAVKEPEKTIAGEGDNIMKSEIKLAEALFDYMNSLWSSSVSSEDIARHFAISESKAREMLEILRSEGKIKKAEVGERFYPVSRV